jgi:hypothetical protein
MTEIAWLRMHDDARVPTQAHANDAGFDLYATEAATLAPGQREAIGCGRCPTGSQRLFYRALASPSRPGSPCSTLQA